MGRADADQDRPPGDGSMTGPLVRRARPDDGPAIAEVWLSARRAAAIPPAAHSDAEVREWISDVLLPSCQVWVSTAEHEVVAMMALDGDWLEQLYVSPEDQRHGHGRRLLGRAMSERTSLNLWTFESNLGAQRFYETHGFVRVGPPSDDNEERAPALRYRWQRSDQSCLIISAVPGVQPSCE